MESAKQKFSKNEKQEFCRAEDMAISDARLVRRDAFLTPVMNNAFGELYTFLSFRNVCSKFTSSVLSFFILHHSVMSIISLFSNHP